MTPKPPSATASSCWLAASMALAAALACAAVVGAVNFALGSARAVPPCSMVLHGGAPMSNEAAAPDQVSLERLAWSGIGVGRVS